MATLETGSRLVSCAGSTNVLTATNQEVAGSSPAGRATLFQVHSGHMGDSSFRPGIRCYLSLQEGHKGQKALAR